MPISYTRVTWYSQIAAIVLFVAVFCVGFHIGTLKAPESPIVPTAPLVTAPVVHEGKVIAAAAYSCPAGRYISALYYDKSVRIILSDGREFMLPQVISASGARYANADESFVFWNKGNTAFTLENNATAYDGCASK
ncbi:MAG: Protein of unknown function periplasmic [Candidatus Parcubacteria bacterium]|nr:Protein of unknown function periplasmic [Candidatus Parcubacteria bacterium]